MAFVAYLLLAFAPGVFWLWFFARKDVYRPAPKRLLALTFFLGMISTIPVSIVYFFALDESVFSEGASIGLMAATMLFMVGPVEELFKFSAVRMVAYRSPYFEEPMDGLIYATAASLGFASVENLTYILAFGPEVMILRAPVSTVAHVVFGCFWGYGLALRKRRHSQGFLVVVVGLALGATSHGLFNTSLTLAPVGLLVAIGLLILGIAWTVSRFNWAQRVSPFRYARNYPKVECSVCHGQIRITSRFCRFCGTPSIVNRGAALFCGYCGRTNRPDASYCAGCGDRLLRST